MADETPRVVLAVDPGRLKCGVAVVERSTGFEVLHQSVVPSEEIGPVMSDLADIHAPDIVLIGNGTSSADVVKAAKAAGLGPIEIIDESFSTLLARKRYFQHNPPRGLRKLIPISLQTPDRPCDDYVAVILGEHYLSSI